MSTPTGLDVRSLITSQLNTLSELSAEAKEDRQKSGSVVSYSMAIARLVDSLCNWDSKHPGERESSLTPFTDGFDLP